LEAAKLTGYAAVVTCLNEPEALKTLNEDLRDCFLAAKRVSVDPSGIALHPEYTQTIGTEIARRRLLALQRIEADSAEEKMTREVKLKIARASAECEVARMEAETNRVLDKAKADAMGSRVSALLQAGLTAQHVANVLVTEISSVGLGRAEKVYVGMSSGLAGFRGVDGVLPLSDSATYERV
jgi:regulator of protease activity HflC (stomatin/prohibitin superfamily)